MTVSYSFRSLCKPATRCARLVSEWYTYGYIYKHQRITGQIVVWMTAWVASNIAFLAVNEERLGPYARRASVAAVINITPSILGGRTCVFADAIGMPLQSYYFLQQWLARLAVAEAFVHFILHIRRQVDWTIQSAVGLAVRNNECPFRATPPSNVQ